MNSIFPLPQPVVIPIAGCEEVYPVTRIFCVGRNYAAHAREMGFDPDREPPFFFTKWASTIVPNHAEICYPSGTDDFHYEGVLVLAIGSRCHNVLPEDAAAHIFGYGTGLDMTRRDLQIAARKLGRPWDTGKNFEDSAPVAALHPVPAVGALGGRSLELKVNGERRQFATLDQMIWSCAEIVAHLSRLYQLGPGDLIFTGTPEGVGAVQRGDTVSVKIEGLTELTISIAS